MLIPEMFVGRGTDVAKRAKRAAALFGDANKPEGSAFGKMIDAADIPSEMFLLEESNRSEHGIHLYTLFRAACGSGGFQAAARAIPWFLKTDWRFLCISGRYVASFLSQPELRELREEYLQIALSYGPELDLLGDRFRFVLSHGRFSTCDSGARLLLLMDGAKFDYSREGALFEALKRHFKASE